MPPPGSHTPSMNWTPAVHRGVRIAGKIGSQAWVKLLQVRDRAARSPVKAAPTRRRMSGNGSGRGLFWTRRAIPQDCSATQSSRASARPRSSRVAGMPIRAKRFRDGGHDVGAAGQVHGTRHLVQLRAYLGRVPGHDIGHQAGHTRPVGGVGQGAHRVLDRMGRRSVPRNTEGKARQRRGPSSSVSRASRFVPSTQADFQPAPQQPDRAKGEVIRYRVSCRRRPVPARCPPRGSRRIAVKASIGVGQRVRTGYGGQAGRAGQGQVGVADRDRRHDVGARNADLSGFARRRTGRRPA